MRTIKRIYILIYFFLLMSPLINAQKNVILGKITVFNVIAVSNVEITVKKTEDSVRSDSLGIFVIECKLNDKLSLKAAGFKTKVVKIKKIKDTLNIDLQISGKESDIQMAVENGHIKDYEVGLAVELFNTKPPYSTGYTNITELILAKYPRVSLINGEFILRGVNSVEGPNGALIVLNGVNSDMGAIQSLAITEVINVEIINGSKAARYGPGGSNGVIYVQTK